MEIQRIEEEIEKLQAEFGENVIVLKTTSATTVDTQSSTTVLEMGAHYAMKNQQVDFVIITPLEEERDAILRKLPSYTKIKSTEDDPRIYFQSDLPIDSGSGSYRIIIMPLLGMGRVQGATATNDAIRRWDPRYVILVGIAGGVEEKGVKLGDVLVSDEIVDYELQKITKKGPDIRWKVYNAGARLLGAAQNFIDNSWVNLIDIQRPYPGQPKRHIGPIASGDKVIDFAKALTKYRETWSKLIGVEMEAGGVALSTLQAEKRARFFMIRGVSDLADGTKNDPEVEDWRPYACDVAAAYTIALLRSEPIPISSGTVKSMPDSKAETQSLDTCILRALYAHFEITPGNHKMNFVTLVQTCLVEPKEVIAQLINLQEKGWIEASLLDRAEAGRVWLTAEGIKVAKNLL